MAELATVARPYAEAAFRSAVEAADLARWQDGLDLAGAIAADAQMAAILANPQLERPGKLDLFFGVGGEGLAPAVRNLVAVLAEADRASLLPEIARQFEALKLAHESILPVRLVSAMPLTASDRDALAKALGARYGRQVEATVEVDETLIGGARIYVGDEVIHASVRDALEQMAGALTR